MPQIAIPAVYMRGGTSRALVFHRRDLPEPRDIANPTEWNDIFLAALGSPDPAERQLDGLGGGISSLSKIAVIGPPSRHDADIDFTFGQVGVSKASVGYRGNCGNIISAVAPFAIDEGLIPARGETATIRIHNTNTGKIIAATIELDDGNARVDGSFVIQGVSTPGSPVRLAFLSPGGAVTGMLLPTGNAVDDFALPDGTSIKASLVDAANPTVFVAAEAVGLNGTETAAEIAANAAVRDRLDALRIAAALDGKIAASADEARTTVSNLPLVAVISPPKDHVIPGGHVAEADVDVITRMISAGQPHKATPLTGAMCLAVAAAIPGTVVHQIRRQDLNGDLRIGHASGILPVAAKVRVGDRGPVAEEAVVYRTARRLMAGMVYIPG
jgi:2-methylaconitate cis-trans-isomerase PrpF